MKNAIIDCRVVESQTSQDGTICSTFCFPETFPGFAGHFPGNPILPAVIQLQIAQVCIACELGGDVRLAQVINAKFLNMVGAGDMLTVECVEKAESRFICELKNLTSGQTASKFTLLTV